VPSPSRETRNPLLPTCRVSMRETLTAYRIARRRAEPGWRAAVLDERASPRERVRKAAANERQPQRAKRAMGRERGDMFLVPERRRSRRRPSAIRAPRCSRRRSAGGADETDREQRRFSETLLSSGLTKTAATQRTAQRAIRHSERQRAKQSARHYRGWHAARAQPRLSGRI
jgi:hypothetical protein